MRSIGVRELKQETSKIMKSVRENGETFAVTYRGETIARIVPVKQPQEPDEEISATFTSLEELIAEIGEINIGSVSAVEMVNDVRRD